jgi:hypothetical protein
VFDRVLVIASALMLCAQPSPAGAVEPSTQTTPNYGWIESFGGADVLADVWLVYAGATGAPWSEHIYSDGFRIRAVTGYGGYKYDAGMTANGPVHYKATTAFGDILAGYQKRFGPLTAKAFIGVSAIEHDIKPFDAYNKASGLDWGPKRQLEFWLNLGDDAWTSLDLGYTSAHDTGSARWRLGWRALPTVSVGPELRYNRNAGSAARTDGLSQDDGSIHYNARAGAFARYEWFSGEISVAAGASSVVIGTKTDRIEPNVTVGI